MNTYTDKIAQAELNVKIDLTGAHKYFASVRFSYDEGYGYIWCAEHKDRIRCSFPMQDATLVKHYKTLTGAKRSFLKKFQTASLI